MGSMLESIIVAASASVRATSTSPEFNTSACRTAYRWVSCRVFMPTRRRFMPVYASVACFRPVAVIFAP